MSRALLSLIIISGCLFAEVPPERLEDMQIAGREICLWYERLERGESNLVAEVLKGQGAFCTGEHYPSGDVFDRNTHSQYYYHSHRPDEHGHFHLFINAAAIPEHFTPLFRADPNARGYTHLVAISMDDYGYPKAMFMANQWVTGEDIYPAEVLIQLLDKFLIDHTTPSWPVNRWLYSMLHLFYPQIKDMYQQRDVVLRELQQKYPDRDIFADREFDTLIQFELSVEKQIALIEKEGSYGYSRDNESGKTIPIIR